MSASQPEDDVQLPLIEHLIELRNRLLRIILAIVVVFGCMFPFSSEIYSFVSEPLKNLLPAGSSMIATDVTSPFFAPFKLTLVVSAMAAMPVILYQIWAFIAPGLYKHEKRILTPLLFSSVALFYAGMAFAYYVVFPILFEFFTGFANEDIQVMTDISSYLTFVLKLFFAFGFAFQIPIAVILLCWTGISDADSLAKKRPYIVVGCFIMGMLLTPPDIISQSLLAVPMWLLFEFGVMFGRLLARRSTESRQ